MCSCSCQQPENLKEKSGCCSEKQIKECHGDAKEHPCCKDTGDKNEG